MGLSDYFISSTYKFLTKPKWAWLNRRHNEGQMSVVRPFFGRIAEGQMSLSNQPGEFSPRRLAQSKVALVTFFQESTYKDRGLLRTKFVRSKRRTTKNPLAM